MIANVWFLFFSLVRRRVSIFFGPIHFGPWWMQKGSKSGLLAQSLFRGVPFFAGGCFDGNRQCGLWTKPREAKNMKLKRKIKLEHYFWTFASSLVPIFKFTADIRFQPSRLHWRVFENKDSLKEIYAELLSRSLSDHLSMCFLKCFDKRRLRIKSSSSKYISVTLLET